MTNSSEILLRAFFWTNLTLKKSFVEISHDFVKPNLAKWKQQNLYVSTMNSATEHDLISTSDVWLHKKYLKAHFVMKIFQFHEIELKFLCRNKINKTNVIYKIWVSRLKFELNSRLDFIFNDFKLFFNIKNSFVWQVLRKL